ncbi:heavy metal translocatin [Trametes coccinea BRFM310]|uniref:Heavy metal translocatin n=1 Tax=Trametes coccinea (strain BRFM310) TaxID=1353009 RepID=A0A1Y2ICQ3_TRAC3|nr:heavy metal translocatin [Trametes coccinea BRFM310]
MTCASCSNAITHALSELPNVSEVAVNLLGNSATLVVSAPEVVPTVVSTIEDIGYEAEVVSVEPIQIAPPARTASTSREHDGRHRVELSVDGMTCASCSNTVTSLLSDIPGVSEVVVNLLGKSATAVVESRDLVPQLVETINDAGYEAEVVSLRSLEASETHPVEHAGPRTVSLRVHGMFCPHCPGKIMASLKNFGSDIEIQKPLTSHSDPILTMTYTPAPPTLNIRSIIRAIERASDEKAPFTATIHKPLSLEDRARYMQRREQRNLLLRLVFSVVVAIPTFIIGIVFMSLVPSGNATRMWFEEPIWSGNASRAEWALFILATPIMFYSAGMFHRRCLKELYALWRRGSRVPVWKRFVRFGSMNMLVSTGVTVAYFASIALLALAASQSPSTSGHGDTTTYFDSVVFLTMFLLAGRFLEAYSKGRTADAITALGKLRPTSALLVVPATASQSNSELSRSTSSNTDAYHRDIEKGDAASAEEHNYASKPGTKVERIDAELLEVGDIVRVLNGASPPADGTIVAGDGGAFDESSLTGESRLVKKQVGDKVFLGTINKAGVVDIRVDEIGGQTMLDHVVKVVREGQTRRAPIERLADLITGYFVPVVTLLAIITWVVWLGLGFGGALPPDYLDIEAGGWAVWSLEFAIAVFVVACPCGIGLAAPTALLVGSGLAAKYGILARGGGEAFQEAAQLDIIVFDKTGTLTEGGDPKVTDADVVGDAADELGLSKENVLGIAMEIEEASSHPLATAIRGYCEQNGAASHTVSSVEEIPGRGLKAFFSPLGCTAIIGNEAWMEEHQARVDGRLAGLLHTWKNDGKSVVLLAAQRQTADSSANFSVLAVFAVADPVRPEAKKVISKLQQQGLGTWMISGDNAMTAKAVAKSVGIPETNVIAEVLPHQKAEKVQWLQQVGMKRPQRGLARLFGRSRLNDRCIVAMVGDGINDAPALTAADVGIAIGSGSDVAISSASFILVSSNLKSLLTLSDLSRTVFNRVKFNFFWASIYNIIALPIAAGVIYPAGHARLPPVWASLAMALS